AALHQYIGAIKPLGARWLFGSDTAAVRHSVLLLSRAVADARRLARLADAHPETGREAANTVERLGVVARVWGQQLGHDSEGEFEAAVRSANEQLDALADTPICRRLRHLLGLLEVMTGRDSATA
ncbi:MAG: hypothetical protein ACRDQ1_08760, partial [Sciscionella sp.]